MGIVDCDNIQIVTRKPYSLLKCQRTSTSSKSESSTNSVETFYGISFI
jgi:hypothetical protein